MALNGSFSGSILSGNYKLRVDWAATQNVANNTSKITAVMYLVQASSWSLNISSRNDNRTTIAGTGYAWTSPAISNGGGKTTKLATVTSGDIAHNADGTKSVTITAVFEINATISGAYRDTITASATVNLNTIPRATQHTLSTSSADMGATVTISMPRASSSFTHDLAYSFNGSSYTSIATGRGTSYSWTVPDRASSIPNATSGKMTVRCITKNGSTTVGTKYAYLTAKVPASVVPTVGAIALQEGTAGIAEQFGAYVQSKSKLVGTIAATGAKGSTIAAYQTTVLGKTYTGSSWTTGVLTSAGTLTISAKVKDSRGRWSATKTQTVTVVAYSRPKIQKLHAYRVDSTGAVDEQGEYIAVEYKYSVAPVGGSNTARAVIQYKRTSDDTWANLTSSTALSGDTTYKPTGMTLSADYQFDVRLTVTDFFDASATYLTVLPSAAVILDILATGKGVNIGGVAEEEGVTVSWPLKVPVGKVLWSGSYYMTGGQTANLTERVSAQRNGIVLVFSRYSSGVAQNYHWNSFFVHKAHVALHAGQGHQFMMSSDGSWSVLASKYLYIDDDHIDGNDNNSATGTANGITYTNNGFVLRYVIGV